MKSLLTTPLNKFNNLNRLSNTIDSDQKELIIKNDMTQNFTEVRLVDAMNLIKNKLLALEAGTNDFQFKKDVKSQLFASATSAIDKLQNFVNIAYYLTILSHENIILMNLICRVA